MSESTHEGLELKEGILLDKEGKPILTPRTGGNSISFRLTLSPWLGTLALVGLVLAGFTVLGSLLSIFFTVFLAFWLVRTVLGLFGLGRRSP
jgi:hypothetical protein